jgi:hypothetical protein
MSRSGNLGGQPASSCCLLAAALAAEFPINSHKVALKRANMPPSLAEQYAGRAEHLFRAVKSYLTLIICIISPTLSDALAKLAGH